MQIQQRTWTIANGWSGARHGGCSEYAGDSVDRSMQLVLVFGSPSSLKQPGWHDQLRQFYPHARLLGCSTAGEIVGTQVRDDGLVATAIGFEKTQVRTAAIVLFPGESSFAAGQRLGAAIEAALGQQLQLVLTEMPEAATEILADLAANKKGRASLAALNLAASVDSPAEPGSDVAGIEIVVAELPWT